MPVFRTKRMPVKALRSSMGLRPGKRDRRGLCGGSKGSIRSQSASVTRGLAMGNLRGTYPVNAANGAPITLILLVLLNNQDAHLPRRGDVAHRADRHGGEHEDVGRRDQ